MASLNKFWDLGEEKIFVPSEKNLARVLNALILCNGKLHSSFSLEIKDGKWNNATRSCAVNLRISLPIDEEKRFEELSGFPLSEPDKIQMN